ncbi:MAG: NAD(P)-dependent oxidoreductase [Actinobacteria bacterium]|nr:NAD(P)-dependent oxidoreductase [Actinomycetota bacterium]
MTTTVLLTGATGFVGRHVLHALADRGVRVRSVVRDRAGALPVALEGGEAVVTTPDLFAEGSDWWANACRGVDTVIHVAWYVDPDDYLQSAKNIECLVGTLELARGAAAAGVRRFVGVGTCLEYDLTGGMQSVDTAIRPLTPYAGAKAAAFMALSSWLPRAGVEFAWCRLFYLHGEGENSRRLVPSVRDRLAAGQPADLTSGDQIRDYLDVSVAGRMITDIAFGAEQGPVNICSAMPITVRQLVEGIADEYGRRDLLRFGARPDGIGDPPCVVGARDTVSF